MTTAPVTGDLRDQIKDAFGPAMRLGLQGAELHDEPGAERIEEWITHITDWVVARLESLLPLGDLRKQNTEALEALLRRNGWDGERNERVDREMTEIIDTFTSVRWPAAVAITARLAEAERRAEHAEGELSALRDHSTRWETEKARADKAEAELEQYRARLAARITDEAGLSWQELLAALDASGGTDAR